MLFSVLLSNHTRTARSTFNSNKNRPFSVRIKQEPPVRISNQTRSARSQFAESVSSKCFRPGHRARRRGAFPPPRARRRARRGRGHRRRGRIGRGEAKRQRVAETRRPKRCRPHRPNGKAQPLQHSETPARTVFPHSDNDGPVHLYFFARDS